MPYFKNSDGTTRILSIWDQTLDAEVLNQQSTGNEVDITHKRPENYPYGVEYTREQINLALKSQSPYEIVPSYDTEGHGTKMASVAAGSYIEENGFRGAAYDCGIIVVKLRQSSAFLRNYYHIPEGVNIF